jgi:hypothetical protein
MKQRMRSIGRLTSGAMTSAERPRWPELLTWPLLAQLIEDRALARSLGQPGAAIKATAAIATLTGFMTNRVEHGAPGEFSGAMSCDQILSLIRAELGNEAARATEAALA